MITYPFLHTNPRQAAHLLTDRQIPFACKEGAGILSNVMLVAGGRVEGRPCEPNILTTWAAANRMNYRWVLEWTNELVLEHGHRFPVATTPPVIRAAHSILPAARAFAFQIPDEEPIYFPLCSVAVSERLVRCPPEYNAIESCRLAFTMILVSNEGRRLAKNIEKAGNYVPPTATWTRRRVPPWIERDYPDIAERGRFTYNSKNTKSVKPKKYRREKENE